MKEIIMKKIVFSKKEWNSLGKKAQAPAPVVRPPPVKAPPAPDKTTPTTPSQPPSRDPFKPPRPAFWPKPKAKKEDKKIEDITTSALKNFGHILKIAQNYQREAHPSVKGFWSNIPQEHPFAEHPILRKHGPKLSEEGFEFSRGKLSEGGRQAPVKAMQMVEEVQEILPRIIALESSHEEELVEMAKDITAEVWGIDKSKLEGGIEPEVGEMGMGSEGEEEHQLLDLTPELKEEINKRITANVLTQGASVHAMASVHHLVAEKIRQISPELLELYTRMSGLATHQYYALDIPAIVKMLENISETAAGWSKVVDSDEGGVEEQADGARMNAPGQESNPKVVAKGICFPVLCQEMFKGVMELLSAHGIHHLSADELYTVTHYADRLEDEPWYITVAPALWRRILEVLPADLKLADFVSKLHGKTPQEVHEIVNAIIENPQQAKEILAGFKEQEVKEQYVEEVPEEIIEEPKKNKGAGELVVPPETFAGLEDIFESKSKGKIKK